MPFDIGNLNAPERFYWPGDEKEEEWVELRTLTDADQLRIIKQVGIDRKQAFKVNSLTRQMERIEYVDSSLAKGEQFAHELFDFCIVAWNLKEPSGKPIECTKENKVLLMTQSAEFRAWVDKSLEKIEEAKTEKAEQLEKNLTGSQTG